MQEQVILFFDRISTPFLDTAAEYITMLGEQYVFIVIISFIFWNISKKDGFKLVSAVIFSGLINSVLKIIFHTPRPFETLDSISGKRVETATGYSFPSGHTQGATTFFISLAQVVRRRWFSITAIVLLLLVGISRMYLGVHWPADVAGGLVIGILMAYIICTLIDRIYDDTARLRRVFFRIEIIVVLSVIALFFVDLFYLKGSMKIENYFKIAGLSAGTVYGFFLQERYIDFSASQGGWFRKILRFIIGLAATLGILTGLGIILPEYSLLDYIRYGITGFWVTFAWPAAGMGMKLFEKQSRV